MTLYDKKIDAKPRLYASAVIGGDKIGPQYWNDYFGLTANNFFAEKGKYWINRSGKQSSSTAQKNVWGYSTRGVMESDLLTPHLEYLIKELKLPRPDMKTIIEENDLKFQVLCFFWNPEHNPVPLIEPKYEDIIRQSGGTAFIDEYN